MCMGYAMSKYEINTGMCEDGPSNDKARISQRQNEGLTKIDGEFCHSTKLRSETSEAMRKILNCREKTPIISTAKIVSAREANYSGNGKFSQSDRCNVLRHFLPTNGPWLVDQMNSRAYVSQFSADGSLFVAGFQGSHIRIYNVENGWKVQKDILARSLRWTVTDTSLSPDQKYLVYASISPTVHIVDIGTSTSESHANINEVHAGLDFSTGDEGDCDFGIFSIKFSTDGRELVAGTNVNTIHVYDLEANKIALTIAAHESDVNAVTFADERGHLIYSGSDDDLCKVWDRRCFDANERPAGVLIGHLEGITFIDSHGDGRYFISNGKDQTIKLWDIRKLSNSSVRPKPKIPQWDYRWMDYPKTARTLKHPSDQSLATYTGHSVLRTLIRCYFSPSYSTGQRYIYTGSNDNCVYIYDTVTGDQVAKLDCHESTVRDCSWHPYYPTLVSSSWDGLVARWEFSGSGGELVLKKRKGRRQRTY